MNSDYRYDRALSAKEVFVCLIDRHRIYPDLADHMRRAADRYGFTFQDDMEALNAPGWDSARIRHLIICDGVDDPEAATAAYSDVVDLATSTTLALHYSSLTAFELAAPVIERLKMKTRQKINYLRPTPSGLGYSASKQKLIDNSICDSVRIKYRPNRLGDLHQDDIPAAVLAYFRSASNLIERKRLYHRASTDGFISLRAPHLPGFYITCTKTDKIGLDLNRIALVEAYDSVSNILSYRGTYLPSSDSVEAAVLYQRLPHLNASLHTHASEQYTRNPDFRSKIAVPPASYGEPDLGDRIADFVLAQDCTDFVIMEDHGEMFFAFDTAPKDCFRRIANLIDADQVSAAGAESVLLHE